MDLWMLIMIIINTIFFALIIISYFIIEKCRITNSEIKDLIKELNDIISKNTSN